MILWPEVKVKLGAYEILYVLNVHGLSRITHVYWFFKKLLEIGMVHLI